MANPKLTYKTPLLPLSWVNVRGQGKLKMEKEDNGDPENYNYTATIIFPDEAAMKASKTIFDKFWRENKPQGAGKQNYDMFKKVMTPTLDDNGKEQRDEDDEIVKHHTGEYSLAAKTLTHWPKDGKQNIVKLLGSNGKALTDGHGLEGGCGEGTIGIIHGALGINAYPSNMGLQFYLNGVQIKESTYTEFTGGNEVEADEIDDDVADTEIPEDGQVPDV